MTKIEVRCYRPAYLKRDWKFDYLSEFLWFLNEIKGLKARLRDEYVKMLKLYECCNVHTYPYSFEARIIVAEIQ